MATLEDFQRIDLRIGEIVEATPIAGAQKLLALTVDLGGERRTLVGGVAQSYAPEDLRGLQVVVVANLEPATIRGIPSQGMLLAAGEAQVLGLSALDRNVPAGTRVR